MLCWAAHIAFVSNQEGPPQLRQARAASAAWAACQPASMLPPTAAAAAPLPSASLPTPACACAAVKPPAVKKARTEVAGSDRKEKKRKERASAPPERASKRSKSEGGSSGGGGNGSGKVRAGRPAPAQLLPAACAARSQGWAQPQPADIATQALPPFYPCAPLPLLLAPQVMWKTLEHAGVLFPPEYEPHGVRMLYDGVPVDLTPEQEEVATFFAVMKETGGEGTHLLCASVV